MKKIAVNTVKAFLAERENPREIVMSYPVDDAEFTVKVRPYMSADEMGKCIRRVLSGCFDANHEYRPEYVKPMIHATVLQMCSNLPVVSLHGERGANGEALMDIDAMDRLYRAIEPELTKRHEFDALLSEIETLCEKAVAWRQRRVLHEFGIGKLADAADAIRNVAATASRMLQEADFSKLTEYAGTLAKHMDGLEPESLVSAILASKSGTED